MSNSFYLKILTGPQQGATITLDPGQTSIGGDDHDLILQGLGEGSMVLEHNGMSINLTQHQDFRLNGESLLEDSCQLPIHIPFSLSEIHLMLSPSQDEWPEYTFPKLSGSGIGTEESTSEEEPDTAPSAGSSIHGSTTPLSLRRLLPLGLLLLLGPLVLGIQYTASNAHGESQLPQPDPQAIIGEALLDPRCAELDWDGHTLNGYLANREELNWLEAQLVPIDPKPRYKVHLVDDLLQACKRLLANYNLEPQVSYAGAGGITLSGYLEDSSKLDRVKEVILADLPAIERIDNQMISGSDVFNLVSRLLDSHQLTNALDVRLEGNQLLVSGVLNEKDLHQWQSAADCLRQVHGSYLEFGFNINGAKPPVLARPKTDTPRHPRIDWEITAVSVGSVRYLTLQDGRKIFEGTRMPGGYTVKRIRSKHIVLNINNREVHFELGGI